MPDPKPKVCVVTSSHKYQDSRIFEKECRSLADAGFRITLLAPHEIGRKTVQGIEVAGFGALRNRFSRFWNMFRVVRLALSRKYDIYHVHELELLLLLPLIRAFRPTARFIYDVHENYDDAIISDEKDWIPAWMKPAVAKAINVYEKKLSRRCDLVVAAAPDIEVRFARHRTISARNFVPVRMVDEKYREMEKAGIRKKSREVVYTGSMTRPRGLLEIVKAMELVDPKLDARFTIFGWNHDRELQREMEALTGYSRVDFHGYKPREEMVEELIQADAAMLCFHPDPNVYQAVERSNKLFEYMAMGLPIIVTNLPSWAEFITRNKCGLVCDPRDPRDIAEKITQILKNPKQAREMGQNGRRAVLREYNWEGEGRKLVEAYQKLLSREDRP